MIDVRRMRDDDLPRLLEISPANEGGPAAGSPAEKNPADFEVFPTIVAVSDDVVVVGYAQFSVTPDKILHSQAIRVSKQYKGMGIGEMLCRERVRLARSAGAVYHLYVIHPESEIALSKILLKIGMHLCFKRPDGWVYAQDLGEPS